MSLLPVVATRGMNAQLRYHQSSAEEALMFPTGHSRRFAGRTLLIIFAIVAIVSAVYQIVIRTDVGRRWLETRQPPKQPDLISQIGIVGFQPGFEYGASHTAWADFTIVNGNPFPVTDIILRCDFQDATRTKISEVRLHLIGPVVPAKGQKAFKHELLSHVSSETRNANCAMADARRHY
jgi:hypothetical protein